MADEDLCLMWEGAGAEQEDGKPMSGAGEPALFKAAAAACSEETGSSYCRCLPSRSSSKLILASTLPLVSARACSAAALLKPMASRLLQLLTLLLPRPSPNELILFQSPNDYTSHRE